MFVESYYLPGTVIRLCCDPHVTVEETDSERLSNLPKVTQLGSGEAGI